MFRRLPMKEECGVFGIWSPEKKPVAEEVYLGLYALQHRGQESCGIAVSCDGVFHHYKNSGLVGEVFDAPALERLGPGSIAVEIGADSLAYLSVDSARRLAGEDGRPFCDGCFTGRYPIEIPEDQGKSRFEKPHPETP